MTGRDGLPRCSALALALAAVLLSGCAGLVRDRIYFPEPMPVTVGPWAERAPQQVAVTTADGLRLRGYYWPPSAPEGDLIVFFHGNAGNAYVAARTVEPLARDGGGVLVASYRGYGDNPGRPSQAGLFADGAAFIRLARELSPGSPLYPFGYSLGSAVALEMAAREAVAGVITLGAFARLTDLAPAAVRGLIPDRYDNLAAIARVTEPVLLIHGAADEVVPVTALEALSDAAPGSVRKLRLRGAPHNIAFDDLAPMIRDNIRQMPR